MWMKPRKLQAHYHNQKKSFDQVGFGHIDVEGSVELPERAGLRATGKHRGATVRTTDGRLGEPSRRGALEATPLGPETP